MIRDTSRNSLVLAILLAGSILQGATNDLRILSVSRDQENSTTLAWQSHPGEFYTVFWTDVMNDRPFWRVAAVNVASQGSTTSWTDDGGGQMMRAGGGGLEASSKSSAALITVVTAEQIAARKAEMATRAQAGLEFLNRTLREAVEKAARRREQLKSGEVMTLLYEEPPLPGDPGEGGTNDPPTARFYRVARTAVVGFVDGWGAGAANLPAGLTNVIAVSAGLRDPKCTSPFTHSLALWFQFLFPG